MKRLIVQWLDGGEILGELFVNDNGELVASSTTPGNVAPLNALVGIIRRSAVLARKAVHKDGLIVEGSWECHPGDEEYLGGIQEMLYDYMIEGRRIAGYVSE